LKSTAAILAAAMFVGDRTTASPSLVGAAAVVLVVTLLAAANRYDYTARTFI